MDFQYCHPVLSGHGKDCKNASIDMEIKPSCQVYHAAHICRLTGHEGSIFRMAWSSDGMKLSSVSDDRR